MELQDQMLRDEEGGTPPQLQQNQSTFTRGSIINRIQGRAPWWLRVNLVARKTNISVVLSGILTLSVIKCLHAYSTGGNPYVLFYPLYIDIVMNMASVIVYSSHGTYFNIYPYLFNQVYTTEAVRIFMKVIICYLNSSTIMSPHPGLGWGHFVCMVILLFANQSVIYRQVYDSIFNMNYFFIPLTMILLSFKVNFVLNLSWSTVFFMQVLIGFLLLSASALLCVVLVITLVGADENQRRTWRLKNFSFLILCVISFFILGMALAGSIRLADPESMRLLPFSYSTILLIYFIMTIGTFCLNIYYSDVGYGPIFPPNRQDNTVEQKTGMNYILHIMQASPTFFVTPQTGVGVPAQQPAPAEGTTINPQQPNEHPNQDPPENNECLICCSNPSNCVIFDCMHSGVCSQCARAVLQRSSTCLICRQPIKKIAVVQKKSDTEYLVTDEIFIT